MGRSETERARETKRKRYKKREIKVNTRNLNRDCDSFEETLLREGSMFLILRKCGSTVRILRRLLYVYMLVYLCIYKGRTERGKQEGRNGVNDERRKSVRNVVTIVLPRLSSSKMSLVDY